MSQATLFRLSALSVVDLIGTDAIKIAQNLTTNDLAPLDTDQGCETFVTDVRGKTIGHFIAYRMQFGLRLLGAPGQSQAFCDHADRYTIREDASGAARDGDFSALVVDQTQPDSVPVSFASARAAGICRVGRSNVGGVRGVYEVPWLGDETQVWLVEHDSVEAVVSQLSGLDLEVADETQFHHRRVLAGFPWYGIDVNASNLPQEADRDRDAICFTKGCYLGQETVARLDALGQVQKKLVRWGITGDIPAAEATLESDGKKVGRLTSVTSAGESSGKYQAMALGFARRSHFDPGATAEGVAFTGEVLPSLEQQTRA